MKKIIILFAVITFSVTKIIAQTEWAPIGAKWCYEYGDLMTGEYYYMTFHSTKDSIIQNKTCKRLDIINYYYDAVYHTKDTFYTGSFLMYGDSNKVYYLFKDTFRLLYDFTLIKGDTFTIYQPSIISFKPIYYGTVIFKHSYLIDSIGSVNISGKQLKRQYLHIISDDYHFGHVQFLKGNITEKLGYDSYIFGEITHYDSYGPYLKCYHDNEIGYKKKPSFNCDGFNEIKVNNEPESIKLYPNPALDKINIDCAIRQNLKMQIYNTVGQCVLQKELNDLTNSIDMSSLTKGIYILKITSPNGTFEKKIIKE